MEYYNDSWGWDFFYDLYCYYRDIPSTEIQQADFTFTSYSISSSGAITGVCGGSYTFEITDSYGCTKDTTFEIPVDLANPVVIAPPDTSFAVSEAGSTTEFGVFFFDDFDVAPGSNGWTVSDAGGNFSITGSELFYNGDDGVSSITQTVSTEGVTNISLSLAARQSNSNFDPTDDYIWIEYNTGSGWTTLLFDDCIWQSASCPGNNQSLTTYTSGALPVAAENNSNFQVRISYETSAGAEDYYTSEFYLSGDVAVPTIDPSRTGTATATDSVYTEEGIEIGYTETVEYFCDSTEFVIHRTWTGTDSCGNVGVDLQEISFGVDPTISCPGDSTLGPCAANYAFVLPTANDACGVRSLTNDYSPINWLSDPNGNNHTNVYALGGDTAIIWTVTDSSFATATCVQNITLGDSIKPSINISPLGEICAGTEITFTVALGGTAVGNLIYDFQVNEGSGFSSVQTGASATYTSSSIGDNYEIRVYVTDDGTSCTEEANVSMDIKPNIKTNLIEH